jgi:hypothetical protein
LGCETAHGLGEGRRAEPRPHTLGDAAGRRAEASSEHGPRGRIAPAASTGMGLTSWSGPVMRTEVGRRFPPIRGTTRAPGVGPGLNKARTADCPPPLCRVRNRRPRAVEGRDTGPLRPQRASIGRNSLPVSRGSVSARTAGGENPRSHAPMSTESARTSPCGLTRSMTSPKEGALP